MIDSILVSLQGVPSKCEGARDAWTRANLYRAIVLIGGLNNEEDAVKILEQKGV